MSAGNCLYRRTEDFRQLVTIRGANLDGSSSELRRRAIVACAQHGTATTSAQHLGKEPAQLRIMYTGENTNAAMVCASTPCFAVMKIVAIAAAACASRSHTLRSSGVLHRSASIRGSHFAIGSPVALHMASIAAAFGCEVSLFHMLTVGRFTPSLSAMAWFVSSDSLRL